MLLDKRYSQQFQIDDYKQAHKQNLEWLESTLKRLEALELGNGESISDRLKILESLTEEYEENKSRVPSLLEKVTTILPEISIMEGQHVKEQTSSFERRMNDLAKRLQRKSQILSTASTEFQDITSDIEKTDTWMKDNIGFLQDPTTDELLEERIQRLQLLSKEIDQKKLLLDSLDKRANAIRSDLEPSEFEEIQKYIEMLCTNQSILSKLVKEVLKKETGFASERQTILDDISEHNLWYNTAISEFQSLNENEPLHVAGIEKRIRSLRNFLDNVKAYEEKNMPKLKKKMKPFLKDEKNSLVKEVAELESKIGSLKRSVIDDTSRYEQLLSKRRKFEEELENCGNWLDKASKSLTLEIEGTVNIATLDEHLQKFKALKEEEDGIRESLTNLVDLSNDILPNLSDGDRLLLQNKMDRECDRLNHISEASNRRLDDLIKNIEHYRKTAIKIEESVAQLNEIQGQIKLLNKPIGHKVEDAKDVLGAYEKILNDLREFKRQLEDLHNTAGTNVSELRALLQQQEELILAIENQMIKIQSLVGLRQSFMELVTGITEFIVHYTGVVTEIEKSSDDEDEKLKKYDNIISKIQDCEAKLAVAMDKGNQIASEGSSQDQNQISEQLQSLKNQLHSLKRAVEKKREEFLTNAAEHKKISEEMDDKLNWLQDREAAIKSRPLLKPGIGDVEEKLKEHNILNEDVIIHMEKLKKLRNSANQEQNLPASLTNLVSQANAILHSYPEELERRLNYLKEAKDCRGLYDSLVERLNNWVEDAQSKLRPSEGGVDFENLLSDLEEHKTYFSEETKLRELLNQIHDTANNIWTSLDQTDKDQLGHEQEFFNQLVKNTINSAHSKQAQLEDNLQRWNKFKTIQDEVENALNRLTITEEKPTTFPGVKNSISKIDTTVKNVKKLKPEVERYNDKAKDILKRADTVNRQKLSSHQDALNQKLKDALNNLKDQKEKLSGLALQWEDFEQRLRGFSSAINHCNQSLSTIDPTFRSLKQLKETEKSLKVTSIVLIT